MSEPDSAGKLTEPDFSGFPVNRAQPSPYKGPGLAPHTLLWPKRVGEALATTDVKERISPSSSRVAVFFRALSGREKGTGELATLFSTSPCL